MRSRTVTEVAYDNARRELYALQQKLSTHWYEDLTDRKKDIVRLGELSGLVNDLLLELEAS